MAASLLQTNTDLDAVFGILCLDLLLIRLRTARKSFEQTFEQRHAFAQMANRF